MRHAQSRCAVLCCAVQVLGEDLKLVLGQQDRLERGSDTWANPVSYDKLGELRSKLAGLQHRLVVQEHDCPAVHAQLRCMLLESLHTALRESLCRISISKYALCQPALYLAVCRRALPTLAQRRRQWPST